MRFYCDDLLRVLYQWISTSYVLCTPTLKRYTMSIDNHAIELRYFKFIKGFPVESPNL